MVYSLDMSAISLLQSINNQVDSLYDAEIAKELHEIIQRAIVDKQISSDDADRLVELLPRLAQKPQKKDDSKDDEEITEEWPEWKERPYAKYLREVEKLRQLLSNREFLQYAVYQKRPRQNNGCKAIAKLIDRTHEL